MTAPDFPMTPPIREAWQRSLKEVWPWGMVKGGGGCFDFDFERLVVASVWGIERFLLCGGGTKVLPMVWFDLFKVNVCMLNVWIELWFLG